MAGARRPGRVAAAGHETAPERRRRAADVVLVCDHRLRCEEASPVSTPMLGYLPEALVESNVGELVHPDDLPILMTFVDEAAGGTPSLPVRLLHHEGSWVSFVASRHGRSGVDFAPRTIGDRIRNEEWLTTQRQLADTILTMASDAILSTDRDGVVVEWNRAAEQLFGWTRAEAVGRDLGFVVPPQLRAAYRAGIDRLWDSPTGRMNEPAELLLLRRDGKELWTEVSAWTVHIGQTSRFNALIRDIGARKEMQRTLTEARKRAEETMRLRTALLATVSHQIRTPANGIVGLVEALLVSPLDPAQHRHAEAIGSAARSLLGVLDNVLEVADTGPITFTEDDFDLCRLIADVVEVVGWTAGEKGVVLDGQCLPGIPPVLRGDARRLRQVLLQLCGNAVKFTRHGEVMVTARPADDPPARPGGARIRVEVADTGVGLGPEEREHVFDAFLDADTVAARRLGAGLGLAVSRRLIEAMNGRIGVDSEVGKGSTFWFEVELGGASSPDDPPSDAGSSGAGAAIARSAGSRSPGIALAGSDVAGAEVVGGGSADAVDAQVDERLQQLSGDPRSGRLVRRMVASFLSRTPAEFEKVTSAVRAGDYPAMQRRAHRLRESAATLGAARLADQLGEIEDIGRRAGGYDESDLVRRLSDEYGAARTALQRRLEMSTGPRDPGA